MEKLLTVNLGTVKPPPGIDKFPTGGNVEGVSIFVNVLIQMLIAGAGLFAVFNLVLAGYAFMSAGGDSKQIEAAWAKIWQTILGVAVAAGAIVIAAIIGILFFDSPSALLRVRIFTPN
jgi:hypothetical protein